MKGWIKIHRQSLNSSVMKNPKTWYIWCWCLMKATHAPQKFPFNGKDIELKSGQFITGRRKALEELKNCSEQNYKTAIKYLKSTSRITSKVTNKFTIISICNWDKYQDKVTNKLTSKVTNQQPASNQPVTTYKNVKNVKNKRNNGDLKNHLVELVLKEFENLYGFKPTDHKPRFESWNLIRRLKGYAKELDGDVSDKRIEGSIKSYFKWVSQQSWHEMVQNLGTIRRKTNIFYAEQIQPRLKGKNES